MHSDENSRKCFERGRKIWRPRVSILSEAVNSILKEASRNNKTHFKSDADEDHDDADTDGDADNGGNGNNDKSDDNGDSDDNDDNNGDGINDDVVCTEDKDLLEKSRSP